MCRPLVRSLQHHEVAANIKRPAREHGDGFYYVSGHIHISSITADGIPCGVARPSLRVVIRPARGELCPTMITHPSLRRELEERGLTQSRPLFSQPVVPPGPVVLWHSRPDGSTFKAGCIDRFSLANIAAARTSYPLELQRPLRKIRGIIHGSTPRRPHSAKREQLVCADQEARNPGGKMRSALTHADMLRPCDPRRDQNQHGNQRLRS